MLGTSESVARINQRLRRIDPDMPDDTTPYKEIPLTKGKVALVDAEDYERVAQCAWIARLDDNVWYAERGRQSRRMHRFILNLPADTPKVDHKDGDGLNN